MAINKIVLNTDSGEQVLVDLTGDTVTADSLVVGSIAHGADGEIVEGANPYELEATNTEVGTQTELIAQINAALESKVAASAGKPEQEKTVEITENGEHTVSPDDGYTLSRVTVNVNVPSEEPNIQPLTVTENGTYTPSGDVDGYGPVTVNVPTGGGGAAEMNMNTCTVAIVPAGSTNHYIARETVSDGAVGYAMSRSYTSSKITVTTRCDSVIYILASNIKSAEVTNGELLQCTSGQGVAVKTSGTAGASVQVTLGA